MTDRTIGLTPGLIAGIIDELEAAAEKLSEDGFQPWSRTREALLALSQEKDLRALFLPAPDAGEAQPAVLQDTRLQDRHFTFKMGGAVIEVTAPPRWTMDNGQWRAKVRGSMCVAWGDSACCAVGALVLVMVQELAFGASRHYLYLFTDETSIIVGDCLKSALKVRGAPEIDMGRLSRRWRRIPDEEEVTVISDMFLTKAAPTTRPAKVWANDEERVNGDILQDVVVSRGGK